MINKIKNFLNKRINIGNFYYAISVWNIAFGFYMLLAFYDSWWEVTLAAFTSALWSSVFCMWISFRANLRRERENSAELERRMNQIMESKSIGH